MRGKEDILAVLMDTSEVRHVFPPWPDDMHLAVCLMASGECRMQVFRREEAGLFPARLVRHLKLPASGISIFPAVQGFPSHNLLFSDERRLLALVAAAPEIVEEAADYSTNYFFALEEGLDPAEFLGMAIDPAQKRDTSAAPVAKTRSPKPATALANQSARSSLPSFLRGDISIKPGAQFRSASEIIAAEEPPESCLLHAERNGWIVVERENFGGGDIRISDPRAIYISDDRRVIAVKPEIAGRGPESVPSRISIRATILPRSLRAVLAQCVGPARADSDGDFLFIHLEMPELSTSNPEAKPRGLLPIPAPEVAIVPPASDTRPAKRNQRQSSRANPRGRRRIWLAAGVATLLVLIGVGLRYGAPLMDQSNVPGAAIDWNQYHSDAEHNQAG